MTLPYLSHSVASALLRAEGYGFGSPNELTAKERDPGRPAFTITISREVGALGNSVAQELGRRLNWPVYDQEILNTMAEQMGKPRHDLHALDERHIPWLQECLTNLVTGYQPATCYSYTKNLVATVCVLGAMGHCIIVGRGAHLILPAESTLRVRLVGDLEDRVKTIRARHGLSEKEAREFIHKTDPQRAEWVRTTFGKDPADARHYDLVLNTSSLSVAECAEIILETLRRMEVKAAATAPAPALSRTD
jgi:cytidylate kinase